MSTICASVHYIVIDFHGCGIIYLFLCDSCSKSLNSKKKKKKFPDPHFSKVDAEEVMYIVKELWHGRSARDQSTKEAGRKMWRSVNELMLVRFFFSFFSPSPHFDFRI